MEAVGSSRNAPRGVRKLEAEQGSASADRVRVRVSNKIRYISTSTLIFRNLLLPCYINLT